MRLVLLRHVYNAIHSTYQIDENTVRQNDIQIKIKVIIRSSASSNIKNKTYSAVWHVYLGIKFVQPCRFHRDPVQIIHRWINKSRFISILTQAGSIVSLWTGAKPVTCYCYINYVLLGLLRFSFLLCLFVTVFTKIC